MGYKSGESSISIATLSNQEARTNMDTGAYCTYAVKGYLQTLVPDWENQVIPIQGLNLSSESGGMKPHGILDLTWNFPHPSQCIKMKWL